MIIILIPGGMFFYSLLNHLQQMLIEAVLVGRCVDVVVGTQTPFEVAVVVGRDFNFDQHDLKKNNIYLY